MAQAITPRHQGEYLQARQFWIRACDLFRPHTRVSSVGFELDDAKSFDDVVVRYREPIRDGTGHLTAVDFEQVKHHATHSGKVTAESLITPAFIGATSNSLLQKLRDAQRQHAPTGEGCRFILRQPWPIDSDDPLAQLIDRAEGHLRLNVLAQGKTDGSVMGGVRKMWRDHLGVDDEELMLILRPLRLLVDPRSLAQIRDDLNTALFLAGLRPVDASAYTNPYDDLAWKLAAEHDRLELDRAAVDQLMRQEQLYVGPPPVPQDARRLGIRSFAPYAMELHNETDALHCALEHFDGRLIRDRTLWKERIYPNLSEFLQREVQPGNLHHLFLETHTTLAFATGYAVARSQARVVPLFRRVPWEPGTPARAPHSPAWSFELHRLGEDTATAVAISVAQYIVGDVRHFLAGLEEPVGHLIEATVAPEPGGDSVQDADHAFVLARDLVNHLKSLRGTLPRGGHLMLFAAAPNPLMFFLGTQSTALGPIELYEFDPRDSTYHSALRLP